MGRKKSERYREERIREMKRGRRKVKDREGKEWGRGKRRDGKKSERKE